MRKINSLISYEVNNLNNGLVAINFSTYKPVNKVGSLHLIEHLLCDYFKHYNLMGYTTRDKMILWCKLNKNDFDPFFRKVSNLNSIEFSELSIANEKKVVLNELSYKLKSPLYNFLLELQQKLFDGHPYGDSIIGETKDVAKLSSRYINDLTQSLFIEEIITIGPWKKVDLIKSTKQKKTVKNTKKGSHLGRYKKGNVVTLEHNELIGGGIIFNGEKLLPSYVFNILKKIWVIKSLEYNSQLKLRAFQYKEFGFLTVTSNIENVKQKKHIEKYIYSLFGDFTKKQFEIALKLYYREILQSFENFTTNRSFENLKDIGLPSYEDCIEYNRKLFYDDFHQNRKASKIINLSNNVYPRVKETLIHKNLYYVHLSSPLTKRYHVLLRVNSTNNLVRKNELNNVKLYGKIEEVRYEGFYSLIQLSYLLSEEISTIINYDINNILVTLNNRQEIDESTNITSFHEYIKYSICSLFKDINIKEVKDKRELVNISICSPDDHIINLDIKNFQSNVMNFLSRKLQRKKIEGNQTIIMKKIPEMSKNALIIQEAAHGGEKLYIKSLHQVLREKYDSYYFVQNFIEIEEGIFYIFWAIQGNHHENLERTINDWLDNCEKNASTLKDWFHAMNSYNDPLNHTSIKKYLREVERYNFYVNKLGIENSLPLTSYIKNLKMEKGILIK